MPPGVRVYVKRNPGRVRTPTPAVGESRCKSGITDGVQHWPNVSEVVEDLIHNLLALQREGQRREENVRVGGRRDDNGPADTFLARARYESQHRQRDREN